MRRLRKSPAPPHHLNPVNWLGIMTALVTTFLGLFVAIPSITAFFFFRNRVIRIIMEVGTIAEELMDRFRPQEETAI